jgi:hypothetical protein
VWGCFQTPPLTYVNMVALVVVVAKTVGGGSKRMQKSSVSLTRSALHLLHSKRIVDHRANLSFLILVHLL